MVPRIGEAIPRRAQQLLSRGEDLVSDKVDHDARLVYVLLRYSDYLDQTGFSSATRTAASQVSLYLRGERTLPEDILERAADARGFPRVLLRPARRAIRSFRAAAKGWSRADRMLAEMFFADLLALSGEALEVIFAAGAPAAKPKAPAVPRVEDREAAAGLWLKLERRNPRQRLAMVEEIEEFQSWAVSELVSAKSIEVAPSSPADALELAGLALRIAEVCAGDKLLCQRAEGYAWFHVANARRVANDIPGSGPALETAIKLWEAGASGDPGLFDETWVLWIEATVRKAQRRFPEARQRIEQALGADRGDLRGKLLLTKAQILQSLGDVESSTEVLQEAIPHIDEQREPRTALGTRCQYLFNLCLRSRAVEAAPLLREVEALAERLGQKVDLVRVGALGGLIAAGTGRAEEAEEAFEKARRSFVSFEPPLVLDYALVSLELALLLLEQNRLPQVSALADQMAWIFTHQGMQPEALAAIRIFCEAAGREAATVELARRVIRFLDRSQYDPELRFEEAEVP
jgi:tetratricopeptide (TPR) repeat protein